MNNNKWSKKKTWDWYKKYSWLVGTNFIPSYAINQLECWQAGTFDLETIERELKWSADLGMNIHRVFLHNLLWKQDEAGFLQRINAYLDLADKYAIKTMFVLFDDVWHPLPKLGKQIQPMKGIHNSGWVQGPGAEILGDFERHDELEDYVKGILSYFKDDERVVCWDLYNEPGNIMMKYIRSVNKHEVKNKAAFSLALLAKVFVWARSIKTSQPLTSGIFMYHASKWEKPEKLPPLEQFMLANSDVISFHSYDANMKTLERKIKGLMQFERPLLCTEYLARTNNNRFENVLPLYKKYNVAAINWGLVSGKTNTVYPWSSWFFKGRKQPEIWFHDILNPDGTPYSEKEVAFIKQITDNAGTKGKQ